MWALRNARHARHVATRALNHARHVGTSARKHARHVDTSARRHVRHVGTWSRKHARHVGTWARKHARHVGTLARKTRILIDSIKTLTCLAFRPIWGAYLENIRIKLTVTLQTQNVYFTLKRRGNDRFYVVPREIHVVCLQQTQ